MPPAREGVPGEPPHSGGEEGRLRQRGGSAARGEGAATGRAHAHATGKAVSQAADEGSEEGGEAEGTTKKQEVTTQQKPDQLPVKTAHESNSQTEQCKQSHVAVVVHPARTLNQRPLSTYWYTCTCTM